MEMFSELTTQVRWVNAIWSVLERTRADPSARSASHRAARPTSFLSSSDADGSSSTHYAPRPANPTPGPNRLSLSPLPSSTRPLYTTDDAVIETSGGLHAPLAERGTRRLAAGLERGRSLRRVASEADLSEGNQSSDVLDPLTADAARGTPLSRDFTFARGIAPPPLSSPPPVYTPIAQAFGTVAESLSTLNNYRTDTLANFSPAITAQSLSSGISVYTAQQSTPAGTAQVFTSTASAHTAQQSTLAGTAQPFTPSVSMHTAPSSTAATTAQPWMAESAYTARQEVRTPGGTTNTESAFVSAHTEIPRLAITEPSSSDSAFTAIEALSDISGYQSAYETMTSRSNINPNHEAQRGFAYSAGTSGLGSPFMTAGDRSAARSSMNGDSVSSYHSAPPPVPSRDSVYSTASLASASRDSSPIRYQLHDNAVLGRVTSSAPAYTARADTDYFITRPIPSSKNTQVSQAYRTAMSVRSSGSSAYGTAPPPPISRSTSPGFSVDMHADSATVISEPDADLGLIADLDRHSSIGSSVSRRDKKQVYDYSTTESTMYMTATRGSASTAQTRFATAQEDTLYQTARESAYSTAPGWQTVSTQAVTAEGTQE